MSYNSKAFLADRERLLEPEPVRGTRSSRWHKDVIEQHAKLPVLPPPDCRTEEEITRAEYEYLKQFGI